MLLSIKNITADRPAAAGTVSSQDVMIFLITLRSTASRPLARPTPITAPTTVWDVDIGRPSLDAINTVVAAPKSTEKPLVLVNEVILYPKVLITLCPHVIHPIAIPKPPIASRNVGTYAFGSKTPVVAIENIPATGPIALATSFAQWEKAT